eukprot:2091766-Prymnesium_polylepis.1
MREQRREGLAVARKHETHLPKGRVHSATKSSLHFLSRSRAKTIAHPAVQAAAAAAATAAGRADRRTGGCGSGGSTDGAGGARRADGGR